MALDSKLASRRCCCRSMGQTDRRTPDRYVDRAPHTLRTASIIYGWPLGHIFPRKIRVPLFIIEAFQVTT